MATSAYLHNHLRAFNEAWSRDHQQEMSGWELDSRIKLAISLYDLIAERAAHGPTIQSAVGNGPLYEEIRDLHALYSEWFLPSSEILKAIAAHEAKGYNVERARDYRERCERTESAPAFDPDRVIQSLHDLEQGKYRPLAEVRDELRRSAH